MKLRDFDFGKKILNKKRFVKKEGNVFFDPSAYIRRRIIGEPLIRLPCIHRLGIYR